LIVTWLLKPSKLELAGRPKPRNPEAMFASCVCVMRVGLDYVVPFFFNAGTRRCQGRRARLSFSQVRVPIATGTFFFHTFAPCTKCQKKNFPQTPTAPRKKIFFFWYDVFSEQKKEPLGGGDELM
jgi:hypothetical protein